MPLRSPNPKTSRKPKAIAVITGLMRISTAKAITAVSRPPTKSTSPVPMRLRTPSTSLMMRDTSMPRLVGVVVGDGQAADVLLHAAAQFGDQLLRGFGERLRKRKRRQSLHERGQQHDSHQRIEQPEMPLADDIVDQILGRGRKHQS